MAATREVVNRSLPLKVSQVLTEGSQTAVILEGLVRQTWQVVGEFLAKSWTNIISVFIVLCLVD